ncbi:MAG: hypothetical protein WCF26_01865 [Candidatus Sulfotelmatobacter sp.]
MGILGQRLGGIGLFAYGPPKIRNLPCNYTGANVNQLLAENQLVPLFEQPPDGFHKNNLFYVPHSLLVVVIQLGVTSRTQGYEVPPTSWPTIAARYPMCFLQQYVRSAASRTPFCAAWDVLWAMGSVSWQIKHFNPRAPATVQLSKYHALISDVPPFREPLLPPRSIHHFPKVIIFELHAKAGFFLTHLFRLLPPRGRKKSPGSGVESYISPHGRGPASYYTGMTVNVIVCDRKHRRSDAAHI